MSLGRAPVGRTIAAELDAPAIVGEAVIVGEVIGCQRAPSAAKAVALPSPFRVLL